MKLTQQQINDAKPADKPVRIHDAHGLYLEILPSGTKCWRQKYRFRKKEYRITHGRWPDVTLEQARQKCADVLSLLKQGKDPREVRRLQALMEESEIGSTLEEISRDFLERTDSVDSHKMRQLKRLENYIFPYLGNRHIGEIKLPEFLSVLRRIEDRGNIATAHRVKYLLGQVMRHAMACGRVTENVIPHLNGGLKRVQKKHHAAITNPAAFGKLLDTMRQYDGCIFVYAALNLVPYVFVRHGELLHAEWSEVDFENSLWRIPKEKMKLRRDHIVPLSRQAIDILNHLRPYSGDRKYIFTGKSRDGILSSSTLPAALRRLGYPGNVVTIHGFRASARTLLDEVLNFPVDIIEHQLSHEVIEPTGRAYNRTSHLKSRTVMMQVWADYLDSLIAGKEFNS